MSFNTAVLLRSKMSFNTAVLLRSKMSFNIAVLLRSMTIVHFIINKGVTTKGFFLSASLFNSN